MRKSSLININVIQCNKAHVKHTRLHFTWPISEATNQCWLKHIIIQVLVSNVNMLDQCWNNGGSSILGFKLASFQFQWLSYPFFISNNILNSGAVTKNVKSGDMNTVNYVKFKFWKQMNLLNLPSVNLQQEFFGGTDDTLASQSVMSVFWSVRYNLVRGPMISLHYQRKQAQILPSYRTLYFLSYLHKYMHYRST